MFVFRTLYAYSMNDQSGSSTNSKVHASRTAKQTRWTAQRQARCGQQHLTRAAERLHISQSGSQCTRTCRGEPRLDSSCAPLTCLELTRSGHILLRRAKTEQGRRRQAATPTSKTQATLEFASVASPRRLQENLAFSKNQHGSHLAAAAAVGILVPLLIAWSNAPLIAAA